MRPKIPLDIHETNARDASHQKREDNHAAIENIREAV
jgi:hypothetical protein